MKHYLLVLFTVSALFVFASGDTLTRAEVYDFSVGDTFDYYHHHVGTHWGAIEVEKWYTYRYVVSDIYWSSDSLIKYIVRNQIFPAPTITDTLTLNYLNAYEVILDTVGCRNFPTPIKVITDSLPLCFGMPTNYLGGTDCPVINPLDEPPAHVWVEKIYARAFGKILDRWSASYYNGRIYKDSFQLVFYSGHLGTYGKPFYLFPNAIEDLAASKEKIKVFSIDNNSAFTIAIPDEIQLPLTFSVYDVQGKKVRDLILPDKKNEFDVQELSRGLYIWKATSKEKFIQSGKVIIR